MNIFLKLIGSAAVVGTLTAISKIFFSPLASLPFNLILNTAQKRFNKNENEKFPLISKIIIVTGSTSGLGREIALNLFRVSLFYFLVYLFVSEFVGVVSFSFLLVHFLHLFLNFFLHFFLYFSIYFFISLFISLLTLFIYLFVCLVIS